MRGHTGGPARLPLRRRPHRPVVRAGTHPNHVREIFMTMHTIATREEWLKARIELLVDEMAHTRRGDDLARRRRELPWVRVDQDYHFATDDGEATLAELFDGRSQMLVYHFMFGPDYTA